MMGQYFLDLKNESSIHNLLRNMKSAFPYPLHPHHQLHHPMPQQPDQVLDLSKRRDSTETRKTTSPSSFEEGSPDARGSPNAATQILLHRHINIPRPQYTPEHAIQYHYEHPSTPPAIPLTEVTLRSPQEIMERFSSSPMLRKEENSPPHPIDDKTNSPPFFHLRQSKIPEHHADESNDSPCIPANISSSSSTTSSQKSPSSQNGIMVMGRDGKLTRPFKAFPRDRMSLAAAAGAILDPTSQEKFKIFRKRMLEQIHAANGGNPVINNPKMRRINSKGSNQETNNNDLNYDSSSDGKILNSPSSGQEKDAAYYERRKKNNAAAKKSRDRRRIKEDELAIEAQFLRNENLELKFELAAVRKQLTMFQSGIANTNL
ncbi:CLUMA_CG010669, isoform A [Clunio marinus]|uniref:CLUMA_CG010669, isoform A n=1 Tax=Clunio marinus TaxID=568069 RepID=A0A1J1IFN7_9DIPT|nr:CLUMA_CG010669, isoform A [Clunio marinus]